MDVACPYARLRLALATLWHACMPRACDSLPLGLTLVRYKRAPACFPYMKQSRERPSVRPLPLQPARHLSQEDRHGRRLCRCSPRPRGRPRRPLRRLHVGRGGHDQRQGYVLLHGAPEPVREGHDQADGAERRAHVGAGGSGDVGLRSISSCMLHAFAFAISSVL